MAVLLGKFEAAKQFLPVLIPTSCTATIAPSHGENLEGLMRTVILYLKPLFPTPHLMCFLASLGSWGKSIYKIQLELNPNELSHFLSTLALSVYFVPR